MLCSSCWDFGTQPEMRRRYMGIRQMQHTLHWLSWEPTEACRANSAVNRLHRGRSPWCTPRKLCPWASRSVECGMWSWRSPSEALPKLVAKGCSGQGQQLLGITLEYYFHVKCVC